MFFVNRTDFKYSDKPRVSDLTFGFYVWEWRVQVLAVTLRSGGILLC